MHEQSENLGSNRERGEGGRQGKDHPGERDVIIVSLDTVRWLLIPAG